MLLRLGKIKTGLEITADSVSAVQVKRVQNAWRIVSYAMKPIPPGLIKPSFREKNITDSKLLVETVASVIKGLHYPCKKAGVVLPNHACKVILKTYKDLPSSRGGIREMMAWDLGNDLNLPAQVLHAGFQFTGSRWRREASGRQELLGVFSLKEIIGQYEDTIVDIGVTPVFTSPASINIYNLFCGRVPVIGTAAFVGVFDNSFHIFVFEDGRLKFYKGKKRGFKDENVFEQIKKTFLFFSMHFPDMQIGEYYFSGRRNIGNGDVEKLYEMLGPEVFVLDASDFVSLGDDVRIDDDAMAGIPGDLSVVSLLSPALGAAVEM